MPRSTVIPVLAYPDVEAAAAWLCEAFGFRVRIRMGTHRIQLHVGDGAVVAAEGRLPAPPIEGSVMVRVEDVDGHHAQAVAHGARVVRAPETHPYGERQYVVLDLAGYRWAFSQSVADVDPLSWGASKVVDVSDSGAGT